MKTEKISIPKIELSQVRLNNQGYTSNGRYYGVGAPLYQAYNNRNHESIEFRAKDRAEAKRLVGLMFTEPKNDSLGRKFSPKQIREFTAS
jgi:hypothetical protein